MFENITRELVIDQGQVFWKKNISSNICQLEVLDTKFASFMVNK